MCSGSTFQIDILQLKDELLTLGSIVEEQIANIVSAREKCDLEWSRIMGEADLTIKAKRYVIEQPVLRTIVTQQPMAHDLGLVASILEKAVELEHINDYAKSIPTSNLCMDDEPLLKPINKVPKMVEKAINILHRSLTAFIIDDILDSGNTSSHEDVVDISYSEIYNEMMNVILTGPKTMGIANWLIWTAHNIEHVPERETNSCEYTIFTALPLQVNNLSGILSLASGDFHSIVKESNGGEWSWVYNGYDELGDGPTFTRTLPVLVSSINQDGVISAGSYSSLSNHTCTRPIWDMYRDHISNVSNHILVRHLGNAEGAPEWIPEYVNVDGLISVGDLIMIGSHWNETW